MTSNEDERSFQLCVNITKHTVQALTILCPNDQI